MSTDFVIWIIYKEYNFIFVFSVELLLGILFVDMFM